jgi:hypothetical protein
MTDMDMPETNEVRREQIFGNSCDIVPCDEKSDGIHIATYRPRYLNHDD